MTVFGSRWSIIFTFWSSVITFHCRISTADELLTITPKAAQIKAVDSKIIFTCTINIELNDEQQQQSDAWPNIVWIGPKKQPIMESRGRVFVERLDERRHRLYITEVKETDAGSYVCKAYVNGTQNHPLTAHSRLDLYDEIKFVKVDTNVSRRTGTSPLINCMASGKPEPEMSWRFRGKRIVVDDVKYSVEQGGLQIHSLQPEDAGVYECRAEVVSQGNLKVQAINLDVLYPPILTKPLTSPAAAIKGSDVSFQCLGHGNPQVEYRWFKEVVTDEGVVERYAMSADDEMNETSVVAAATGSSDGSLLMRAVDVSDNGKYVCSISNNLGSTETSLELQILVPPEINLDSWQGQLTNITLTEGQSIELPCTARGRPEPEVYWTTDHQYVDDDDAKLEKLNKSTANGSHVLKIANATKRDAKIYTCTAVNKAGVATQDIAVIVNYAPTIVLRDSDNQRVWSQQSGWSQYGWAGQNRTFRCEASGRPAPDVVWLRGDDDEYVTSDEIYSITETREDETTVISFLQVRIPVKSDTSMYYSRYSCVAKNSFGFDNYTAQLAEALVPEMPRNATVLETTSRNIRLTATGSHSSLEVNNFFTSHIALGGLDLTSWIVTYHPVDRHSSDSVTTLKFNKADDMLVKNLQPNTKYVLTVSAVNVVGVGSPAKLIVSTAAPSDDDKEFDVDVQSDDGRSVAVHSGSGLKLRSRSRAAIDDEELFAVVDWGNTSAVLVVVGAVLLTTVVAAVLALVLHTRRRLVNDGRTTANSRNTTVLNNRRERPTGKNGDLNEVTTVNVSEGRDVDNLTLQIRGRRPPSPGASIPDELYRSLGRNTKKMCSETPQYGSAVPSPRLGSRPGFGPSSTITSLGLTSPLPSRAITTNHQPTQLSSAVDVSTAQKEAWNQMIRETDKLESVVDPGTVNVDMSAVAQQLEESSNIEATNKIISNDGVTDSDDSDVGFDNDDDDDLYDQRPQPVFEGKSFLSYSP